MKTCEFPFLTYHFFAKPPSTERSILEIQQTVMVSATRRKENREQMAGNVIHNESGSCKLTT